MSAGRPSEVSGQPVRSLDAARTDAERVARFRAGEAAAFEELLAGLWDPVVAYVERLVGDRDTARDIGQETFLRLWAKRHEWTQAGTIRAFLYRTARNLAIDEHRQAYARKHGVVARHARETAPPPTPARELEINDLQLALEAAVKALPPQRREVFTLYHLHNLSYRQIAEVMGIKPQVVANYMSAALAELRVTLRPILASADQPPSA